MSELTDALRRYASELDAGRPMQGAVMATIIVVDDKGNCNASYLGRNVPARDVGIGMCAMGIERFLSVPIVSTPWAPAGMAARSST